MSTNEVLSDSQILPWAMKVLKMSLDITTSVPGPESQLSQALVYRPISQPREVRKYAICISVLAMPGSSVSV